LFCHRCQKTVKLFAYLWEREGEGKMSQKLGNLLFGRFSHLSLTFSGVWQSRGKRQKQSSQTVGQQTPLDVSLSLSLSLSLSPTQCLTLIVSSTARGYSSAAYLLTCTGESAYLPRWRCSVWPTEWLANIIVLNILTLAACRFHLAAQLVGRDSDKLATKGWVGHS